MRGVMDIIVRHGNPFQIIDEVICTSHGSNTHLERYPAIILLCMGKLLGSVGFLTHVFQIKHVKLRLKSGFIPHPVCPDRLVHIYHHHHHHVELVAQISLTLSRHSSLSFIALGRSSGQHPVSSHSYWMYVRAGRPAFARLCVGVHKSTSLMSSSLLLQQCPACLVRLTWIVFVIGGRWPYSWCLVGCCRQDLFKIACNILV